MLTVEATKSWLANAAAITSTLHRLGAHWVTVASSTLVHWIGSQGVPKVAHFALVTMNSSCVMDALETSARQVVTVPRSSGVHIVVALTGLTWPHWAPLPKGVPKVAIGTELAAGTCDPEGAVIAHHVLCLGHHRAAEPIATGTLLAAAGVARIIVETNGAVGTLDVRVFIP